MSANPRYVTNVVEKLTQLRSSFNKDEQEILDNLLGVMPEDEVEGHAMKTQQVSPRIQLRFDDKGYHPKNAL